MSIRSFMPAIFLASVCAFAFVLLPHTVRAEVVGMWNFNDRIAPGTTNPLTGDYPTIVTNDERGPDLERLFSTVPRSDLENDFAPYSVGRETLRLHAQTDAPVTTDGAAMRHRSYGISSGLLPAAGSFTWEFVVAVSTFSGPVLVTGGPQEGVILDNSSGQWLGSTDATRSRLALTFLDTVNGTYQIKWYQPWHINGDNGNNQLVWNSTFKLNLNEYYHIAAVYDEPNNTSRLYVNGVQIAVDTSTTLWSDRSTGFALGTTGPDVTYRAVARPTFQGSFDALAFSNDVRGPGSFMIPEPSTAVIALLSLACLRCLIRRRA